MLTDAFSRADPLELLIVPSTTASKVPMGTVDESSLQPFARIAKLIRITDSRYLMPIIL
jgi:hypothetical protein